MSYNVYRVQYLGVPRNHTGIFVETEVNGSGKIFHVTGDILNGMKFETKPANRPDESGTYVRGSKARIGEIKQSDMPRFEEACRAIPPPGAQLRLNGQPKDPSQPIRRCTEWADELKQKVLADGIVTP